MIRRRPLYNPTFTVLNASYLQYSSLPRLPLRWFCCSIRLCHRGLSGSRIRRRIHIGECAGRNRGATGQARRDQARSGIGLKANGAAYPHFFADSDERYKMLLEQVGELESEKLAAKQREIAPWAQTIIES